MINIKKVKRYCKEDISKIKNYEEAVNDTTQVWDCHHMTETWWNCSKKDLIENECYYNRKACELIFLTHAEHASLHMKGRKFKLSEETKRKLSEANKGNTYRKGKKCSEETCKRIGDSKKGCTSWNKGKATSIFGKAFKEHYGFGRCDDIKLYSKEYEFYRNHSHFSWEVK